MEQIFNATIDLSGWFVLGMCLAGIVICIWKRNSLYSTEKFYWMLTLFVGLLVFVMLIIGLEKAVIWENKIAIEQELSVKESLDLQLGIFRMFFQIFTALLAVIAFMLTYLNFSRKMSSDTKDGRDNLCFHANFDRWNIDSSFTVMNLKDRSVTIFEVVIKFKNVSITLPFNYPFQLKNYESEPLALNTIFSFVESTLGKESRITLTLPRDSFLKIPENELRGGNSLLEYLAKEEFEVWAATNIRKNPVRLTRQEIEYVTKENIHIKQVNYGKDELWEKEYDQGRSKIQQEDVIIYSKESDCFKKEDGIQNPNTGFKAGLGISCTAELTVPKS